LNITKLSRKTDISFVNDERYKLDATIMMYYYK